ncbi:hypothetical protein ESV85_22000 [Algoriphagus aquimarinus]|uniref:Uncharacterized protein n=1 Tax=Algoriphagus aquimarinus TaxID=237018 RepID=A0A5C7A830_9BACT|nr:hypothetical protein ESV85_22000 [Algoriphagus aquimarinus]
MAETTANKICHLPPPLIFTARWEVVAAGQAVGMCGGSFATTWLFVSFGPSQKKESNKISWIDWIRFHPRMSAVAETTLLQNLQIPFTRVNLLLTE